MRRGYSFWLRSAIAACGLAASGQPGFAQRPEYLRLEEVFAWPLPHAFDLVGASVSSSGAVLMWGRGETRLLVSDGGRLARIDAAVPERPVSARLLDADSLTETVDGERKSVIRLNRAGALVAERRLDLPFDVESAVWAWDDWVVAGPDSAGFYHVAVVPESAPAKPLYRLDPGASESGMALSAHLSQAGDDVLLTLLESPFHVVRLTRNAASRSFPIEVDPTRQIPAGGPDEDRSWVSLAMLPLDRGYLRVFSDLRSDLRLMALYDDEGRFVRALPVSVPLGTLASIPEQRLLLMVRRTNEVELVGYRWRWDAAEEP